MIRNTSFRETGTSYDVSSFFPTSHYFARLISPPEVAEATLKQPLEVREKTNGHWVLSGDVTEPIFGLLKAAQRKNVGTRITGFTSSGGFSYLVLTHQVERSQHRFLLSLSDPAVRTLLESISADGKLTFLLGKDDGEDALLLENPWKASAFLPVLAMAPPAGFEVQRAAMKELPDVQDLMGRPNQVPTILQRYAVKEVSVSMLLPSIITNILHGALAKAVGK
jgi:hypothetical protein